MKLICPFLILLFATCCSKDHKQDNKDYLLQIWDTATYQQHGYINLKGDTVIPLGKYSMCYTDTFRTYAIVHSHEGFIAIDRNEKKLFEVFHFDNGPDYPSEGLIRIISNNKIGYANQDGEVVIKPQFDCAFPFENGKAKVSNNCKTVEDGEHTHWVSDHWFYIDKDGKMLK